MTAAFERRRRDAWAKKTSDPATDNNNDDKLVLQAGEGILHLLKKLANGSK